MTILESDIAQGLTSKVVHNYLRHVQVKFENFWEESGRYEFSGKDQYSAPSVSVTV